MSRHFKLHVELTCKISVVTCFGAQMQRTSFSPKPLIYNNNNNYTLLNAKK